MDLPQTLQNFINFYFFYFLLCFICEIIIWRLFIAKSQEDFDVNFSERIQEIVDDHWYSIQAPFTLLILGATSLYNLIFKKS